MLLNFSNPRCQSFGQWYFPNGTAVPNPIALSQETGMTVLPADLAFYRTRDDRVVLLHRNSGGVNGMYRCEVPDASGVTQNLYIGIFDTKSHPH